MKKKELVVLVFSICIGLMLVALPLMAACAKPAPAPAPAPPPKPAPAPAPAPPPAPPPKPKPIVLKAITPFLFTSPEHYILRQLIERVNERAKGELTIEYLGGPEVIPTFEQPEAVKNGIVDMISTPYAYMGATVPEGSIYMVSPHTWAEEREKGLNDFLSQLYREKMNMYYLGGANKNSRFAFVTKVLVKSPQELEGLKFRAAPPMGVFQDALGIVPVTMPLGEVYGAIQQGVVDGHSTTLTYSLTIRLYEVCDYFIDHFFWGGGGIGTFINLDKWNAMPKHLQDLLNQVQIELEPETYAYLGENDQKVRQTFIDKGTEPITFSEADAKYFIDLANETQWELLKGKASPENYAKLREFLKP